MMQPDFKSMSYEALEEYFESIGEKKYRAGQVFRWLYRGAESFDDMSDLSAGLRDKLKESAGICPLSVIDRKVSKLDGTRKYLFKLHDGYTIESVFMKYKFGNSICISSQAGCRMGCIFCASGKNGFSRDLTAGEMADQVIQVQKDANEKIGHVVVMGVGEPFENYDNMSGFIQNINDKRGLNIGMRSITVSTCGIVPKIKSFSADFPQANLAVSLHASNEALRKELMPVAGKQKYSELMAACLEYTKKTGRRITFEYVLIRGKNDGASLADELASNLSGMLCHVNLIPLNNVPETRLFPCTKDNAERFAEKLERKGVAATIRREMGGDIGAACGQLRLSKIGS